MSGGMAVRTISPTQNAFMYVQAMGSTQAIGGVNSFSGLGGLLSSCYPEFNPELIKGFEVRLSQSLVSTNIPAILSQDITQSNIALGIKGVETKVGTQILQGNKGVELILGQVEKELFSYPQNPAYDPVAKLQFMLPSKTAKAALVITGRTDVPRQVVTETFQKLSEDKKIDLQDIDTMKTEIERLRTKIGELEKANRALFTENQALPILREKLSRIESELDKLKAQVEIAKVDHTLADEVPGLRKDLREAQEEVRKLSGELEASKKLVGQRDGTIEEKTQQIDRLNEELRLAKAEVERLGREAGEKDREIQSGVKEIGRLTKLLDEATRQREEIRLEKERLEGQTAKSKPEMEAQSKELAELKSAAGVTKLEIQQLKKVIGEHIEEKNKLVRENGELKTRALRAEKKVGELEGELKEIRDKVLPELNGKLKQAEAEAKAKGTELGKLQGDVSQLRTDLGSAREELKKLKEETIPGLEGRLRQGAQEKEASKAALEQAQRDLASKEQELGKLRVALTAPQQQDAALDRASELEQELRTLKGKTIPLLEGRLEQDARDQVNTGAALAQAQRDLETSRSEAQSTAATLKLKEEELKRSKTSFEAAQRDAEEKGRKIQELIAQAQEASRRAKETERTHSRELEAGRALVRQRDGTISEMTIDIGKAKAEVERLRGEAEKSRQSADKVLRETVGGAQVEIDALKKRLSEITEAKRQLGEEKKAVESSKAQSEAERKKQAQRISELEEAGRRSDEKIQELGRLLGELTAQKDALESSNRALNTRAKEAEARALALSTQIARYESEAVNLRGQSNYAERVKQDLARVTKEIGGLRESLGTASADNTQKGEEIKRLKSRVEDVLRISQERAEAHGKEVAGLQRQVSGLKASADIVEINFIKSNDPEKVVNPKGELEDPRAPKEEQTVYFELSVNGMVYRCELAPGKTYTLGSTQNASIVISGKNIAEVHMIIENHGGRLIVKDVDATSGLYIGKQKLRSNAEYDFTVGMNVNVGGARVELLSTSDKEQPYKANFSLAHLDDSGQEQKKEQFTLLPGEYVTVGRKDVNFVIDERSVSRRHLVLYNDGGRIKVLSVARYKTSVKDESFRLVEVEGPAVFSLNGELVKLEILSKEEVTEDQVREYKPIGAYNPSLVPVEMLILDMQAELQRLREERNRGLTIIENLRRDQKAQAQEPQVSPVSPSPLVALQEPSGPPAGGRPISKQKIKVTNLDGNVWGLDLAPGEEIIIGRKNGSNIPCNSVLVSGSHAAIRNIGGNLYIIDLSSKNGTRVKKDGQGQGNKIQAGVPIPLVNGDTVTLGDVVLSIEVQSRGYPGSQLTALVDFKSRIQNAKARLQGNNTSWAARYPFPQRLTSFSGLVIDSGGKREIILIDYTSDTALTSLLQEIVDLYGQIKDTNIGQVIRAFLSKINGFSIPGPPEEVKSGIGNVKLLTSYSSENIRPLLLALALQIAGIRAVYQGGVIQESKLIGKKETERSWVYLPDYNLLVDPVTGLQLAVSGYKADKELNIPATIKIGGKDQKVTYSSSKEKSNFFIPTYERLEQNLIDILDARGHFSPALKASLVSQMLVDLREYDPDLKDRGQDLVQGAIDDKIKKIITILTHFDVLTEGVDPILKGQLADLLRAIYLGMVQKYSIPSEKITELLS